MRYTLSLLICALAVASISAQSNSSLIVRGMIEGIASSKGWADMSGCMSNNDALTSGLSDAIGTFNMTDNNTYIPAAVKLGKALQKVPVALKTCNNSIIISKNIAYTLTSFASLNDFIRIIGANFATFNVELFKEAYRGNNAYVAGQMKEFGNQIGMAIGQVFFNGSAKAQPKPDANTTSTYMLVAQGFVEGFSTGLKWTQVKACMTDKVNVQNDMDAALRLLVSSDPQTFAQGIGALGSALVDVPQAIVDCNGARDKAMNLASALATLQDFQTYTGIVQNNLKLNILDIYEAIYTITVDLKVGAYKDFGNNLGLTVSKLFFDNVQAQRK